MEKPETARSRGDVDIALIGLMRDAMLRVSEAAALTWGDIEAEKDGTGRLLVRRSKTDANGEGAVLFVSAQTMADLAALRTGTRPNPITFLGCVPTRSPGESRKQRKRLDWDTALAVIRHGWVWRGTWRGWALNCPA